MPWYQSFPYHGIELWQVLGCFYQALTNEPYQTLDIICEERIVKMESTLAMHLLDYLTSCTINLDLISKKNDMSLWMKMLTLARRETLNLLLLHHQILLLYKGSTWSTTLRKCA